MPSVNTGSNSVSTAYSWSPSLYSAYAATLEELGRQDEADEWWARVDRATEALAEAADDDAWETVDVVEETFEVEGPADGDVDDEPVDDEPRDVDPLDDEPGDVDEPGPGDEPGERDDDNPRDVDGSAAD